VADTIRYGDALENRQRPASLVQRIETKMINEPEKKNKKTNETEEVSERRNNCIPTRCTHNVYNLQKCHTQSTCVRVVRASQAVRDLTV